jgi:hypothetical protein
MNELRETRPFLTNTVPIKFGLCVDRKALTLLPLWRRVRVLFSRPILRLVERWLR